MPTDFAQLANEVLRRCRQLATYSEDPTCLTRTFLSPPMAEVHRALGEWMQTLGMSARVDAMGNFVGRREGASSKRTLLLGSHLDTVPNAGAFDGVLGVLVALAAVKTLEETPLPFAVDVIGFSEEEGVRFAKPYLGSRAIAGSFDLALLTRQDARQISLQQALLDFGLDPAQIAAAAYHAEEVVGFLEAHLEQGPILESLGVPVGLVEGIVGQSRLRVRFVGAAGHAGTTPMALRRDALAGASEFVLVAEALARRGARVGLAAALGLAGGRGRPVARVLPRLQPGAVRVPVRIRLRPRDPPGLAGAPAAAWAVRHRPPADEPGLLPVPPHDGRPGVPVLPSGWPRRARAR